MKIKICLDNPGCKDDVKDKLTSSSRPGNEVRGGGRGAPPSREAFVLEKKFFYIFSSIYLLLIPLVVSCYGTLTSFKKIYILSLNFCLPTIKIDTHCLRYRVYMYLPDCRLPAAREQTGR